MGSSSTESESMSDYEMSESPPPAVIDADKEEIMSVPQNTMNSQDPKMKGPVILDAVPVRVVPYGGKEPIAFDKENLGQLRNQYVPSVKALYIRDGKQEEDIPKSLLSHQAYKDGDWKAFTTTRVDGHKDWTYKHREYRRDFRSIIEVKEFLDTNGPVTGMFRGKTLHKKEIAGQHSHGSIGTSKSTRGIKAGKYKSTSKSTRGRKATKHERQKVSVASGPSIWPYSSNGFV